MNSALAATPAIPAVADVAYPGTLKLSVDATDLDHRIFRVHEEIPVSAGPHVLLYPQWLPGNHAPRGPIDKVAGLVIRGNGQPIEWKRDPVEVYAFHLEVPDGVNRLDVEFDFLSPQDSAQGRIVMTPDMLNLQWNTVALYPAGYATRGITVAADLKLPHGWSFGCALDVAGAASADGVVSFKPVPLNTLVDSPMFAGRHYKRVELAGGNVPVHLNVVADDAKDLDIKPAQLKAHVDLVTQARKLFGTQHYDHYDFLLALSDTLGGIGLEHHRSSENSADPGYFTEWDKNAPRRDLLAHEYTHSWNGKFRRPADLTTANFSEPMQGSLLWVYEGQTQYWGYVLAARSGLWSTEQARDALALVAANYADNRPGFAWRNVQDTTGDPVIAQRKPLPYRNYQMSEDYYSAGQLVWLAVDAKLRELSRDKRSLDDFAHAFFGGDDGSYTVKTYTFDDVAQALDGVAHFDWATFLHQRIDAYAPPLDGIAASGWRLVYTESPSAYQKSIETSRKLVDFSASIGLVVSTKDGKIADVRWDGPAFKAGAAPAGTLVAVNGREFKSERLRDAIAAAKGGTAPIELLVKTGDAYRTVRVDYRDGLKYPHLERIAGTADRLDAILAARK
ncbi:MAG: peptidase M61 [Dokdonella sp.]|uniref:M61 family metallopeptidase n=1 Tax=Dokdonella sp. TaxID=2291710 RepID=UPI00326566F5